ncbi:LemA family protein [Stappia indica]|uniref:LemA family protein n=1 Tax=Stappia indica TaxID=538381 RepID=A0A857C435_9HYPH|nr:LemA family protein [Stappia indica]QGZ33760.1 LemA family protein [Stappia indica]
MFELLLILAVAAILIGYIAVFNGLGRAVTQVVQGWAGVEVQLKRRHDLVPGLVSAVRAAQKHEVDVFDRLLSARAQAMAAIASADRQQIATAEAALGRSLGNLVAYAEDNPEVTATANLQTLQRQLEETEDQIAAARRLYNGNVQNLNARIVTFPGNLVASIHGFRPAQPFEMTGQEKAVTYEAPILKLDT